MVRKRMTRLLTVLSFLAILSLLAASCSAPVQTSGQATAATTSSSTIPATTKPAGSSSVPTSASILPAGQDLMSGIQGVSWSSTPAKPDPRFLDTTQRFSANLMLQSARNKGNVMVSPASVLLALAMTLNGADGETRQAMLQVLADRDLSVEQVNAACQAWIRSLAPTGKKTTLSIANSIWFRDSFQPDPQFLQKNADYFRAGARKLDFADDRSTDIINGWVKDQTHGLIARIVEKISPSTVMFLINTVYFKADWQVPFEPAETRKRTFQTPAGAVMTEFMHRTDRMVTIQENGMTGVSLPYDDGQFAYFAMMPEGAASHREWLSRQIPATLFGQIAEQMAKKPEKTVSLSLPKYKAEFEDSLLNELETLGMGIAFDGGRADFSLLNAARSKGLFISEVKHKTFIQVDEKGTEAAAATSVAIDESAPAYDIELTFDRPFVHGIMDMATGIPLFVGILENPAG